MKGDFLWLAKLREIAFHELKYQQLHSPSFTSCQNRNAVELLYSFFYGDIFTSFDPAIVSNIISLRPIYSRFGCACAYFSSMIWAHHPEILETAKIEVKRSGRSPLSNILKDYKINIRIYFLSFSLLEFCWILFRSKVKVHTFWYSGPFCKSFRDLREYPGRGSMVL